MDEKRLDFKLQEYSERNSRWIDIAMSQLTFLNNLLITLAIGFLAFAFDKLKNTDIRFLPTNIDWQITLYMISFLLLSLSIFIGILAAQNRLLNFRITRNINQTRYRVLQYSGVILDTSTVKEYSWYKADLLQFKYLFSACRPDKICIEECKDIVDKQNKENLESKFKILREWGHNLGVSTLRKVNLEIFCFATGFISYVLAVIL